MKQLTCEMCGSTDLLKDGGVFVCQTCGCKYSVEEARKMMVEGTVDVSGSTVKVDTSDQLNKLLVLATRARKEDNTEDAKKYYEMAMIEDPNNWESAFYASYYRLMDSPIGQLPETLKNFNNRAISSLELIFSEDFHGNLYDTVNDFMYGTAKLYTLVSTHEIQNRDKIQSEFINISMSYAFGKTTESIMNARREEYSENLQRSFGLLSAIRATILKLCALAELHKSNIDLSNLTSMYDICDTIYQLDAKSVVEMKDYLDFTNAALSYEIMRKEETPDFVSKGVEMLIEKGTLMYDGGKGNPKGKEITDLIEKRRSDYRKEKSKLYWDAHPQEYDALTGEIDAISRQIKEVNTQYDLPGRKQELASMTEGIEQMIKERDSLGIFKGKEKKMLQIKIDEAKIQCDSLTKKIATLTAELEEKLKPLSNRMEEINTRLSEGR